ncbi:hypothetical protein ACLESO_28185 [Pyxidicoccus sp. 3LG]
MFERARARRTAGKEEAASDQDLRRRLEGRVEVVEVAVARFRRLETALKSSRWRRRLRDQQELVGEALRAQAVVAEAEECIRRHAEAERWPVQLPVLRTVRELEARRGRLHARVRRRLDEVELVSGRTSLEQDLSLLESRVREPVRLGLAPGEVYVFEPAKHWQGLQTVVVCAYLPLAFVVFFSLVGPGTVWAACAAVALLTLAAVYFLDLARRGNVYLTTDRLLWMPSHGEPAEVRLESISAGGVRVGRSGGLVVEGDDRTVRVKGLTPETAGFMAFMVEALRHSSLRDRLRAGGPGRLEVVSFPAAARGTGGPHEGQAILTPRALFFLPRDSGPELLQLATGLSAEDAPVAWVVEVLRLLPEHGFEACMSQAAGSLGGRCWWRWDASYRITKLSKQWTLVSIFSYGVEIRGIPRPEGLVFVRCILSHWTYLEPERPSG